MSKTDDQLESAVDAFLDAARPFGGGVYIRRETARAGVRAVLEMRPKVSLEKCAICGAVPVITMLHDNSCSRGKSSTWGAGVDYE